jgi:membrane protease YdiL (CAAX protease family)
MLTRPVSIVAGDGTTHIFKPEQSLAMKRMNLRKHLNTAVLIAGTIMAASALADTQQGGSGMGSGMMGGNGTGWMGGGYGGIWVPILLVAVVAGLVGWILAQKRK